MLRHTYWNKAVWHSLENISRTLAACRRLWELLENCHETVKLEKIMLPLLDFGLELTVSGSNPPS